MPPVSLLSKHEDWSSIVERFIKERAPLSCSAWSDQQMKDILMDHRAYPQWRVCGDEKSIFAIVIYCHFDPVVEVLYLETALPYQKQGYMTGLLNELLIEFGHATFWLDVHVDNLPAQQLYRKLGFQQSGLRKGYYRDGGSGLVLSRPARLVE